MESLKEKTAKGLFWGALSSGTMQVLNLVFGIVLARLLLPEDYGLIGMITVFTAIAGSLQDSGFGVALVNQKHPTQNDYASVFWFNVGVSLACYVVLFFCAPLIAAFFHEPRLTAVSRFVFVAFLFSSMSIVPGAILTRELRVKEKAFIGIAALLFSGAVGIAMAYKGFAYWSLAAQQVAFNAATLTGRLYCTRWRPTLPQNFEPVRRMFGFSYKLLITNILTIVNANVLTLIFGRLFPAKAVGNYTQANKWNVTAYSFVASTVAQVAQPVLVELQDEADRERRVFRKMLRFTAFLGFPIMFGFAIVAPEFIKLTITERWGAAIPLLQVLCIGGAFLSFYTLYQNLAVSHGRSDLYMWLNIAQIVLQIGVILLFAAGGIERMVLAYTVFTVLWLLAWHFVVGRLIRLSFFDVLKDVLPFLCIAVFCVGVAYWAASPLQNLWLRFGVKVVVAAALYIAVMKLTGAKIFDECVKFLLRRKA